MEIFSDEVQMNFYKDNFRKNYLYKPGLLVNHNQIMSIDILNELLSMKNIWNNKNFSMTLNRKTINYTNFSSQNLDGAGINFRPDINMVQHLISKGASIILNEIERYSAELSSLASYFQKITHGRCQGNLYFSMESHQALGPHCDHHDVFAVHFEGKKVWNIYETIEKNPINHTAFKYSEEERIKKAGKIIDQVTLKPGDLLYIPRGQYHDAVASENGAVHIAFGLTYFKPIDLMSSIWDKFILNEFMRSDIKVDSSSQELKAILARFSKEIEKTINSEKTEEILSRSIKNWPYEIQDYKLKQIVSEGRKYNISKSVNLKKQGLDYFLTNGKDNVLVPKEFVILTQFIFKQEIFTYKFIVSQFQNIPEQTIKNCIKNLQNMEIIN